MRINSWSRRTMKDRGREQTRSTNRRQENYSAGTSKEDVQQNELGKTPLDHQIRDYTDDRNTGTTRKAKNDYCLSSTSSSNNNSASKVSNIVSRSSRSLTMPNAGTNLSPIVESEHPLNSSKATNNSDNITFATTQYDIDTSLKLDSKRGIDWKDSGKQEIKLLPKLHPLSKQNKSAFGRRHQSQSKISVMLPSKEQSISQAKLKIRVHSLVSKYFYGRLHHRRNKYIDAATGIESLLADRLALWESHERRLRSINVDRVHEQNSQEDDKEERLKELDRLIEILKTKLFEIEQEYGKLNAQHYLATFFGNPLFDRMSNSPPPEYPSGFSHIPPVDCNLRERRKLVGSYIIGECIGAGSQASGVFHAYRCYQPHKQYAVKTYSKSKLMAADLKRLQRLEMELAVLKDFPHPNFVKFIKVLHGLKNIYVVTKRARADLLGLCHWYKLQKDSIRVILKGLLTALVHLHTIADITHFDVKPGNILVDFDIWSSGLRSKNNNLLYPEDVKLCDFGLCCYNQEAEQGLIGLRGTKGYYAPELLSSYGVAKNGPLCDMWSVGASVLDLIRVVTDAYDDEWTLRYSICEDTGCSDSSLLQSLLLDYLDDKVTCSPHDLSLYFGGDESFYDLVCKRLLVPAERRITAREALAHEFMREGSSTQKYLSK